MEKLIPTQKKMYVPVSYTHLDVYKRQVLMALQDCGARQTQLNN